MSTYIRGRRARQIRKREIILRLHQLAGQFIEYRNVPDNLNNVWFEQTSLLLAELTELTALDERITRKER